MADLRRGGWAAPRGPPHPRGVGGSALSVSPTKVGSCSSGFSTISPSSARQVKGLCAFDDLPPDLEALPPFFRPRNRRNGVREDPGFRGDVERGETRIKIEYDRVQVWESV